MCYRRPATHISGCLYFARCSIAFCKRDDPSSAHFVRCRKGTNAACKDQAPKLFSTARGKTLKNTKRYSWAWATSALLAVLITTQTLSAHAILLESSPPSGSRVSGPELLIWLRFNVRIDQDRSRLVLVRPDQSTQVLTITKQASREKLIAKVTVPQPGLYQLRWTVLASDGHITTGEIPFTIDRF